MNRRRYTLYSAPAVLILVMIAGCEKEAPPQAIHLPPTPVLTVNVSWGVVNAPYLRMREAPRPDAPVKAPLYQHSVVEIISKGQELETVENKTNFWYQVNYDGLRGWVFGAYLDLFDSRDKAEAARKEQS